MVSITWKLKHDIIIIIGIGRGGAGREARTEYCTHNVEVRTGGDVGGA